MPKQYLYAAAVQGIQGFIFETNKLREIAGASELVESVCKHLFRGFRPDDKGVLIEAAGNIKYLFDKEEDCRKAVLNFPLEVAKHAPGLGLSQAVLEVEDGELNAKHINEIERLLQIQRNLPSAPASTAWMIARRVPVTGKPQVGTVDTDQGEPLDRSMKAKNDRASDANRLLFNKIMPFNLPADIKEKVRFPVNLNELVKDTGKSWIAVVHADGNDLGKLIPNLFKDLKGEDFMQRQRDFSQKLDKATTEATQQAVKEVFGKKEADLDYQDDKVPLPLRPIVCGGDDLTVILRAQDALPFTQAFLKAFEKKTKACLGYLGGGLENGLTACAGIAFVKAKFPFHYAAELAEELCSFTKSQVRGRVSGRTPSGLSFYKIESSFVRDYPTIRREELTTPNNGLLSRNPYLLNNKGLETFPGIEDLNRWLRCAQNRPAAASRLRRLLSLMHDTDRDALQLEMRRIESIHPGALRAMGMVEGDSDSWLHIHDLLSLYSFTQQKNRDHEQPA